MKSIDPDHSNDLGPYFDDLEVGQIIKPAPPITVGSGEMAIYQAICGDPMAVFLSKSITQEVTGQTKQLVNPGLVMNISIGQSTAATQRVIANLFYKNVAIQRFVQKNETLQTVVKVRGLSDLRQRSDRPARGLVLLGIETICLDSGETVVDYERCAMLLARNHKRETSHTDNIGQANPIINLDEWITYVPTNWDLSPLAMASNRDWNAGNRYTDPLRDTVTDPLLLVRLTQNQALPHRDPAQGVNNNRLIYGGHTIGLAQASLARMMPETATVIGWQFCDHIDAVYEGDVLTFHHTLLDALPVNDGQLRAVQIEVTSERDSDQHPVLDWRIVTWSA